MLASSVSSVSSTTTLLLTCRFFSSTARTSSIRPIPKLLFYSPTASPYNLSHNKPPPIKQQINSASTTPNRPKMETGKGGQFHAENIPPQAQDLPGLEKEMQPSSESTRLEGPGQFRGYAGVGKLRDKKVIITGGEYVCPHIFYSNSNQVINK